MALDNVREAVESMLTGEQVRNEIAVLKRVSMGHQNILTLVDYFETMNNRTLPYLFSLPLSLLSSCYGNSSLIAPLLQSIL